MAYAIITGGGKIGYFVTRSLINNDYEVVLLEKDAATYQRLAADLGDVVMQGDGCDPLVLKTRRHRPRRPGGGGHRRRRRQPGDQPDSGSLLRAHAHHLARQQPQNEALFDQLGIKERVSSTSAILNLVEAQSRSLARSSCSANSSAATSKSSKSWSTRARR